MADAAGASAAITPRGQPPGQPPHRRLRFALPLVGCLALACYLCFLLAMTESTAVFSAASLRAIGLGAIPILLLVALGRFLPAGDAWEAARALTASRRWAEHRCVACEHPMPPQRFDGPCTECGADFARPHLPTPRRRLGLRRVAVAYGLACLLALLWLTADLAAFRAEAAARPGERYARPRWWPAATAGFVATPDGRVSAHD